MSRNEVSPVRVSLKQTVGAHGGHMMGTSRGDCWASPGLGPAACPSSPTGEVSPRYENAAAVCVETPLIEGGLVVSPPVGGRLAVSSRRP